MEKTVISIKGTSLKFKEISVDDTLLDSGLSSNISLPYGCKSGACGSCASKLLVGSVKTKAGDIVTNNNTILLCQSYPASNKIILSYSDDKLALIQKQSIKEKSITSKDYLLQVVANKSVTPMIKELSFYVPPKLNFQFLPGAHMLIYDDSNTFCKKYSIINTTEETNSLKKNILKFLITKNTNKGLSDFIHNRVKIGDILKLEGPFSSFQYKIEQDKPILAIAGGSGISPILSIVKNVLFKNKTSNILIFLSVRDRNEVLEMDTFNILKEKYKNFSYKVTLSREEPKQGSHFLFGRTNVSLQKVFKDLSTHQIIISGSDGFVETTYDHVIKLKANKKNIYYEKFSNN